MSRCSVDKVIIYTPMDNVVTPVNGKGLVITYGEGGWGYPPPPLPVISD